MSGSVFAKIMKTPKLLIFDVDGTIVDSFHHGFKNAKKLILRHTNEEITEDEYRDLIKGNPWENIFARAGLKTDDKMSLDSTEDFIDPYTDNKLFDEIKSLLKKFAKQFPMAIITSTFIPRIMEVFEREQIDAMFTAYMGPEVSIYKNIKLTMAMKEYGVAADEILFVTDTVGDVAEAQKVNVPTVGVTWGFSTREQLEEIKPDYLVGTVKELEELILN
jgi:phosphoglycolate phosphatase